jgi:hypothetical protein
VIASKVSIAIKRHHLFEQLWMHFKNTYYVDNVTGNTLPPPLYPRTGAEAIYSPSDINRVYGRALGKNDTGDVFGHASAVFDLDDDGFEDIVIAANDKIGENQRQLVYISPGASPSIPQRVGQVVAICPGLYIELIRKRLLPENGNPIGEG